LSNNVTHFGNSNGSIGDDNIDQKSVYLQSTYKYSYEGRKKRTELGQLFQILEYVGSSDNTQISSIARSNNMSHEAATRNCEKLVSVGLVTREITRDAKRFRLTSDGRSFLNECRNFGDVLCKYNMSHTLYH